MIERTAHVRALSAPLRQFPVVAILGPRQIGKTTLARQFVSRRSGRATFFDLESPEDLDVLTETFMVRQLQGWYENISKRQVKAPKIYLRDSGLLHALLGLWTAREIESHPKVGAS